MSKIKKFYVIIEVKFMKRIQENLLKLYQIWEIEKKLEILSKVPKKFEKIRRNKHFKIMIGSR